MRAPEQAVRSPEQTQPQAWDRLGDWLTTRGRHLSADSAPQQFSGGLANLNYLICIDDRPAVLRRPPAGPIAEGANDMAREARVLSQLADHYTLAPRCLEFCEDVSVLGAPFQIIEYRQGVAIGADMSPELAGRPDAPERLTAGLLTAMSRLHALDPVAVGLADLGWPTGFLGRQVEGWGRRCQAAYEDAPPIAARELIERLRQADLQESATSLLHCDLKFDNMLVDVDTVEPVAVIDWDMATHGDPLFDLAILLSYWIEPSDPVELHDLRQVPSLAPGFLTRREVADRYFAVSGRAASDLTMYVALARLRLAVAWQQLHLRYVRGVFTDPRYAEFGRLASTILTWTVDTLNEGT
jgi:aminoglycoside phosphotransferase (APT) family kinase protein